jgi:hypothetical protein
MRDRLCVRVAASSAVVALVIDPVGGLSQGSPPAVIAATPASERSLAVVLRLQLLYVVWRVEGRGVRAAHRAAPSGV